jgi:hypothetical protein
MMRICPICKKKKDNVAPKVVGKYSEKDPGFVNPQQYLKTVVMCNGCLGRYKKGEIEIVKKS